MRRFDARKAVIEALKELGLYRGSEDNAMVVPVCSRSKDIIEPLLKAQWYVKCDEMARKAVAAVESGELKLIPDYHVATWNRWLQSSRDWCISRQLWWGHRIPAYFITVTDGKTRMYWTHGSPPACGHLLLWGGQKTLLICNFTSHQTFLKLVSFPGSFLLSQLSERNEISPRSRYSILLGCQDGIHESRADRKTTIQGDSSATRHALLYSIHRSTFTSFSLISVLSDVASSSVHLDAVGERLQGANISGNESIVDKWILSRMAYAVGRCNAGMEAYNFTQVTTALYEFWLYDLCDIYLEFVKPVISAGSDEARKIAKATLYHCVETGLRLISPVMPFLSEELWQHLPRLATHPPSITVHAYPETSQVEVLLQSNIKSETIPSGCAHVIISSRCAVYIALQKEALLTEMKSIEAAMAALSG
ncbi:Anticodon-binding domain protein [Necator americanus]|uniref:valine--tRNA ligase n=1 Tax=Necator americanus TaxID=51031 RepID=W2SFH7_NECAM|nr:Anticodon-binding domain protein [Necator americanus]ETN68325.1 Anticodon-binding domain protein [Necator americanus]